MGLPNIAQLLLGLVLDYLRENADKIVAALKAEFLSLADDAEVQGAIQELGYSPSEESLHNLNTVLEAKGEKPEKVAKVLLNETSVV
jgi:glycine betaine/choline ABC-type transport system substrate-binding protein